MDINDITDDDLGNGLEADGEVKIDDNDLDPKFLAGAKEAKTPEELEAEEQAVTKAAEDAIKAEEDAATKLLEEQEAEKKGFVPKGRFNEINEEKKAALEEKKAVEEENKRLKAELEASKVKEPELKPDPLELKENEVVELDLVKQAALTDYGFDSDEYRQAVKNYNRSNRQLMQMEADAQSNRAVAGLKSEEAAKITTKAALDEVAEQAYEVYPFLNKNSDDFDQQAIDSVLKYRNALIKTGDYSPAQALQEAIDELAPGHAARIGTVKEDVVDNKVAQIKEAREKAAKEKAALATRQQPVIPSGRAVDDSFKPEIDKMTPKEIAELSEDQFDVLAGNK